MEFRTTIKTAENRGLIHHSDAVMLLGSCFSDNIGAKMRGAMMRVDVNPFGTIYNPMSIAASMERLISAEPVAGIDLFEQNGVWNSYAFHSRFSLPDKQATLGRMNRRIAEAHRHLAEAQVLVVTLGTAMVYRRLDNGRVVSNCHKVQQYQFLREMATVPDITTTLTDALERLWRFNPAVRVIFTVSPIRHIADGLEVNSLIKATLRVADLAAVPGHLPRRPQCTGRGTLRACEQAAAAPPHECQPRAGGALQCRHAPCAAQPNKRIPLS